MDQHALLITPQGERIELPPEVYQKVEQLLAGQPLRRTRDQIDRTLRETYGKYRGGASLTQALLEERRAEQAREEARMKRFRD